MSVDFSHADRVLTDGLRQNAFTAACLLAGQGERVLHRRAFGQLDYTDDAPPANEHTLFDIDSITKPLVVGMLCLRAIESGRLCLWDKLGDFIDAPEDKRDISIGQILTHTAGFPLGIHLWERARTAEESAGVILSTPLAARPGAQVHYCCAGYILLGQLLECIYQLPLDELAQQEVFGPLRMRRTGYLPADGNIAATEMQDDGRCLQGLVHDENAQFLGGVSGNAGVFSTMDDLALWLQMLAQEGRLPDGTQYLNPATVRMALRARTAQQERSLLFQLPGADGFTGDLFLPETTGHTGFTGCSVALEPASGFYAVLLTNRVCPSRDSTEIFRIRRLVHNALRSALPAL